MKAIYRNTLFFIALFQLFGAFSQENPLNITVIPPTPDAAALGKYTDVPVNLSTGAMGLDIPLYTVQSGKLTVPISLSYHGGGVRVEEMASSVGLGWSLNAGGVISRTIRGQLDNGTYEEHFKNKSEILDPFKQADFDLLNSLADNLIDGIPDLYTYNFSGKNGRFVWIDGEAVLMPFAKVEFNSGLQLSEWEVVDENGIIYVFGEKEKTKTGGQDIK